MTSRWFIAWRHNLESPVVAAVDWVPPEIKPRKQWRWITRINFDLEKDTIEDRNFISSKTGAMFKSL